MLHIPCVKRAKYMVDIAVYTQFQEHHYLKTHHDSDSVGISMNFKVQRGHGLMSLCVISKSN